MAAPRTDGPISMPVYRRQYSEQLVTNRLHHSRVQGVDSDFEMKMPWLKRDDGTPDPRNQVSIPLHRVMELRWRSRGEVTHPGDHSVADMNMSLVNLPAGSLIAVGPAVLRMSDVGNDG
jgi:hypothetical protein